MDLILREAVKSDMAAVLALIKELAVFEREPNAVEINAKDLERDGFGPQPAFRVIIAQEGQEILGMALIYERYSTWKGRALHLEDLIVKKEHRKRGIGRALYEEVLKFAHEKGYRRVTWEVLDWNQVAIDFYTGTGARIMDSWKVVHMDEGGLHQFVQKLDN